MQYKSLVAGAGLALSLALCGLASAQMLANPRVPVEVRGGDAELQREIARIDALIRAVESDRRDDGGYRVRAIRDLTDAREALRRAIAWDRSHGGVAQ
jgi:hypothetical protein